MQISGSDDKHQTLSPHSQSTSAPVVRVVANIINVEVPTKYFVGAAATETSGALVMSRCSALNTSRFKVAYLRCEPTYYRRRSRNTSAELPVPSSLRHPAQSRPEHILPESQGNTSRTQLGRAALKPERETRPIKHGSMKKAYATEILGQCKPFNSTRHVAIHPRPLVRLPEPSPDDNNGWPTSLPVNGALGDLQQLKQQLKWCSQRRPVTH